MARRLSMAADGSELLALALSYSTEQVAHIEAVESLVEASGYSPTSLMAACSYAQAMARDKPLDTSNQRTLDLLTRAVQRAAHLAGAQDSGEQDAADRAPLMDSIVETAGEAAVAPGAVASRTAELDAAVDSLRAGVEAEDAAGA